MEKNIEIVKEELKTLESSLTELKNYSNKCSFEVKKALQSDFFFDAENWTCRKSETEENIEKNKISITVLKMVIDERWNIEYHSNKLEEAKNRLKVLTQNSNNENK